MLEEGPLALVLIILLIFDGKLVGTAFIVDSTQVTVITIWGLIGLVLVRTVAKNAAMW